MPCTGSACDRPPRPADPGGGSSRPRRPPRRAARWPACGGTARPNWPGRGPRRRGPGSLTRPTAAQRREATRTPLRRLLRLYHASLAGVTYISFVIGMLYHRRSRVLPRPRSRSRFRVPRRGKTREESHIIAAARYEISHFTVWRFDEHYVSLTRIDRRCIWRVGARDNRRARRPARRHDS
jgi:hypothetical protein